MFKKTIKTKHGSNNNSSELQLRNSINKGCHAVGLLCASCFLEANFQKKNHFLVINFRHKKKSSLSKKIKKLLSRKKYKGDDKNWTCEYWKNQLYL